ncbi:MAG: transmembrane sensor [Marivirga sp.]|jgi:transmembrane sensor
MKNNNFIYSIDFEIIWKSLHTQLSKGEQAQLSAWLDENKSHQTYYQKAEEFYAKEALSIASANLTDLRKEMEPYYLTPPRGNRYKWIGYRSVAAAFLLMALSVLLFVKMNNTLTDDPILAQKAVEPIPGGQKAILHIEGEENIILGKGSPSVQKSKNATQSFLNISSKSLTYGVPNEGPIKQHILETPRGGEFKLTLTDGTKVWINAASKLIYPSRFSKTERVVTLEGEAYFEVTHDSKRPFIVHSGKQQIKVLGTSFNLTHYPNEAITSTLVKGKIQIDTKKGSNTILSSGEQATYNQNNESLETKKVNTNHFTAWKDGLFYFNDEPLEEIMKALSKWYDFDVIYKNEKIKDVRFTGTLKRYESFKEVTNIIQMTGHVNFKLKGTKVIIE